VNAFAVVYIALLDIGHVGRLDATVEASVFVAVQILIRYARVAILGANDRMAARPEFESDDITRQGVDTVWREVVSRVTD